MSEEMKEMRRSFLKAVGATIGVFAGAVIVGVIHGAYHARFIK